MYCLFVLERFYGSIFIYKAGLVSYLFVTEMENIYTLE